MSDASVAGLKTAVLHLIFEANRVAADIEAQQEEIDGLTQLTAQVESANDLFVQMTASLQEARRRLEEASQQLQSFVNDGNTYVAAL